MKCQINLIAVLMIVFLSSCRDTPQPPSTQGYNMLLIGNSFFRPYAANLEQIAIDAGFVNHNDTVVFRGGENGWPINFWNDSTTDEHYLIKSVLDEGGVEFFGMTSGHDPNYPDDRIEGHRRWIEYALQNNPNINIFIAIPPIDYPADWEQLAEENEFNSIQELYAYWISDIVHASMIDKLRAEFPSTNIFTIPTGWATFELAQMKLDNLLLDEISMFGPKSTSIFTDQKGHQGQIVIETGTLLWLNSLYGVDLSTNTYYTGYSTDLHEIAQQIAFGHDPNYKY